MFTESAQIYDTIYGFKDYAAASSTVHELIQQHAPRAGTLLDVGCGTGKHLEHLRSHYEVEGMDLNPDLLAVARERCPGIALHLGDMVDFHIDHTFDVVTCLFSAIAYVKTVEAMQRAVATMASHLSPGGLLIIEPFFSPEQYWTNKITVNHVDEDNVKITWMYTSGTPRDQLASVDIHYLVGRPERVDSFVERHEWGLFTHDQHITALRNAGLTANYLADGLFGRGLYLGKS